MNKWILVGSNAAFSLLNLSLAIALDYWWNWLACGLSAGVALMIWVGHE